MECAVAHQRPSPSILGWTDMMLRKQNDQATVARGLDIVARKTRLQKQLISDLLDISRSPNATVYIGLKQD
jgi:two-component system CheB/CheR fusion protein